MGQQVSHENVPTKERGRLKTHTQTKQGKKQAWKHGYLKQNKQI